MLSAMDRMEARPPYAPPSSALFNPLCSHTQELDVDAMNARADAEEMNRDRDI